MKIIKLNYFLILLLVFNSSCDSSSSNSDDDFVEEPVKEIVDDYNLVAVSDLGEIFEIGNITGKVTNVGQFSKENSNTILSANTLIANAEKIYAVEYVYNPSPTNNLLIFDRISGATQIIPLEIPSSIKGDERGIVALARNKDKLIGVLAENVLTNNAVKHLISIDLQNKSITDLGITFNENRISSMKLINSKVYISTWGEGFLEIDLIDKSVSNFETINGSRLAQVSNSELAMMQAVTGSINGAKPALIDLSTINISESSNGEVYGLVSVFGNTIFDNGIYINLVSSNSLDLYLGILKTNFSTNKNTIVNINSTTINRNLIIVDRTR